METIETNKTKTQANKRNRKKVQIDDENKLLKKLSGLNSNDLSIMERLIKAEKTKALKKERKNLINKAGEWLEKNVEEIVKNEKLNTNQVSELKTIFNL